MPLRILAGIVEIGNGPSSGTVTIGFNPHEVVSGDARVVEMSEIGQEADFLRTPTKHVALRQLSIITVRSPIPSYGGEVFRLIINDTITPRNLVITWGAENTAFSEEISYLVIGETGAAEPAAGGSRRPRVPSLGSAGRRPKG